MDPFAHTTSAPHHESEYSPRHHEEINTIASMITYTLNRISKTLINDNRHDEIMESLDDEIHDCNKDIKAYSDNVTEDVRDYLEDVMYDFEINNPFSDYD